MQARKLPETAYLSLKAVTRRLVAAAGGLESAATITRVSRSRLGCYAQVEHEQYIAADIIADLEADVGAPLVTRELARLAGYQLVPLSENVAASAVDPAHMVMGLALEVGGFAKSVEEMDEDGVREPHEIRRCLAELARLIDRAERFRGDMHKHLAVSKPKGEGK